MCSFCAGESPIAWACGQWGGGGLRHSSSLLGTVACSAWSRQDSAHRCSSSHSALGTVGLQGQKATAFLGPSPQGLGDGVIPPPRSLLGKELCVKTLASDLRPRCPAVTLSSKGGNPDTGAATSRCRGHQRTSPCATPAARGSSVRGTPAPYIHLVFGGRWGPVPPSTSASLQTRTRTGRRLPRGKTAHPLGKQPRCLQNIL